MIALSLSGRIGRDADACGRRGRETSDFRVHGRDRRIEAAAKLSQRLLEGCGCQRFERKIEDVAVGAEAFEGPREVSLRRDP